MLCNLITVFFNYLYTSIIICQKSSSFMKPTALHCKCQKNFIDFLISLTVKAYYKCIVKLSCSLCTQYLLIHASRYLFSIQLSVRLQTRILLILTICNKKSKTNDKSLIILTEKCTTKKLLEN